MRIRLVDERPDEPKEMNFYFEGGVASFVRYLTKNRTVLHDPVYVERDFDSTMVEAAIQYTDGYSESVFSFANTINTPDGGTHLTGLRSAVTRCVNDYARKQGLLKEKENNFTGEDTREGLTAIISVKLVDPQFESQTKVKLLNNEVRNQVESAVAEAFGDWMESNPREAKKIIEKCTTSARARAAARKARDLVIRKSALESMTLPGKLADCSERDPAKVGTLHRRGRFGWRFGQTGARPPLPGHPAPARQNPECGKSPAGQGPGQPRDSGLDHGSGHRHRRSVQPGQSALSSRLHHDRCRCRWLPHPHAVAHPFLPLHGAVDHRRLSCTSPSPRFICFLPARDKHYVYTEAEKDRVVARYSGKKMNLQRYKGLGEMNPEQLWETTMNPENRTALQVTIQDAAATDRTFDMLMGGEVAPTASFHHHPRQRGAESGCVAELRIWNCGFLTPPARFSSYHTCYQPLATLHIVEKKRPASLRRRPFCCSNVDAGPYLGLMGMITCVYSSSPVPTGRKTPGRVARDGLEDDLRRVNHRQARRS